MSSFSVLTTLLGALVLILALGSKRLPKSSFPPTVLALGIGILLSPAVLGWVDLAALGGEALLREHLARLTLGIALVGVALRVPREFPRRHLRSLGVLVGPGMLLMWAVSTLLVWLFLDLPFWLAALIGAILTPTDPVAASPIVVGSTAEKNLPERLRHTISLESGANDGLGYLFVLLPFLMLTRPAGEAISHWLTRTLLWEVIAATVVGVLAGYAAGKLLAWSESRESIESDWRLIYTVALALVTVGAGRLMGSDEILVVFAAGATFAQVTGREERTEEKTGQEAVDRFFSIPIFAVLGLTIPWEGWAALGWNGIGLAVAVLLLRRPPVLLLLHPLLRQIRGVPEALFLGWFGPIAISAIYYASLMEHRLHRPEIWHVVSLVVCASVLVHGATGAPGTRLFGRVAGKRSGQKSN